MAEPSAAPSRRLDVPDHAWAEAVRREAAVRPLAAVKTRRAIVAAAARPLGLRTAQFYRLIQAYRAPLAIVQIDHVPVDIQLVDDRSRAVLGRPWLTLLLEMGEQDFDLLALMLRLSVGGGASVCLGSLMGRLVDADAEPARLACCALGLEGARPAIGRPRQVLLHACAAVQRRGA